MPRRNLGSSSFDSLVSVLWLYLLLVLGTLSRSSCGVEEVSMQGISHFEKGIALGTEICSQA